MISDLMLYASSSQGSQNRQVKEGAHRHRHGDDVTQTITESEEFKNEFHKKFLAKKVRDIFIVLLMRVFL